MKWELEYTDPDILILLGNLTESPVNVGSKAINVVESVARMAPGISIRVTI